MREKNSVKIKQIKTYLIDAVDKEFRGNLFIGRDNSERGAEITENISQNSQSICVNKLGRHGHFEIEEAPYFNRTFVAK